VRKLKLAVYWAARRLGLFALARRATRKHLKILCYHAFAVRDETAFRPRLFMSGTVFRQRMQTLAQYGVKVLTLDQALRQMYAGELAPDTVVITIDDGFQSVQTVAVPVLREFAFPSTLYVTSYYVEHDAPVFRLVVQYLFERSSMDTVTLAGEAWHADGMLSLRDRVQRDKAIEQCIRHGEQADEGTRQAICARLGELLGVSYQEIARLRLFHLLRPADVAALAADRVDVQLHTHRHRFSMDSFEDVQREIDDNRAALGKIVPHELRHFCYPSGEWEPHHGPWLKSLGVASATTCLPGLNSADTSPFQLLRFVDGEDIHQLEFEAALSGFSDLLRGMRGWLKRRPDAGARTDTAIAASRLPREQDS
jgi:peptidoglycan/xylan/chitin deacetylase (PgdA/CDA1 family)